MSNLFARTHTTGEWLRSSLYWTGSCLGTWWLGCVVIFTLFPRPEANVFPCFFFVGFCVAHGLIWWQAVAGGRAVIRHDEQHSTFSCTRLAANLWLVTLILFQLACLLGLVLLGVWVLTDTPTTPPIGRFAG